jgi:aryl-alcohol dehydrogenase-like predicted oxidoreductase
MNSLLTMTMALTRFLLVAGCILVHLAEGLSHDELSRRQTLQRVAGTTLAGMSLPAAGLANAADALPKVTVPTAVPTVKLGNSELKVSRTIQGYWQLAGGHGKYTETAALSNMQAHFDAGITTMDTADIYGPSESIIGKFVKTQPAAIPITKFCCFRFLDEINREEVKDRIQRACEKLQVAKLPLVQFFWSNYDIKKYVDVGLWLTELKEEGLIGEIGATNFDLKRLQELKKGGVPIVSHQVQLSALDRRPVQSGMADWCAENNVSMIGFGTVGSGILSNRYLGKAAPTQEERNTASMRMYSSTAARFGDWKLVQELLQTMNAVANQVQKDGRCPDANISNIAQRYVLDTPAVASVLIGVRNQNHIAENIRTHSFELKQDERDAIDKVVQKREGPAGDVWDIERGIR